jgi:rod shape determining protein RodA
LILSHLLARFPWSILAASTGLMLLGWLGIMRSEELAGDEVRYGNLQMAWSSIAALALMASLWPNYRRLIRYSYLLFATILTLLVAVYFLPSVHGTHRWIRVGAISLQPSEFAKLAYVLALARWLMYRDLKQGFRGLLVPLGLTLAPSLLVLREPDLGTAMVFLPVLFVMLFAAGVRLRQLACLAMCGALCLPVLWTQMSREQRSRVTALFAQNLPGETPSDDGYHLHQAKQLLALGGVWGSLLAGEPSDDPAAYRLPEDHTDFIFIVLGERLGWGGAAAVLGLMLVICWRGLLVAERTREPFGRLAVVGVVALFAVQTLINTAMTVGLLPVTGLSLPLVSYGGSGLVAHALALGVLFNVAVHPGYEVAGEPFRST